RGLTVNESKSLTHAPLGENGGADRLAAAAGTLSPSASLIKVRSEGSQGVHQVTGMLRRDGGMRFVAVDGLHIDMAPTRHMLVSRRRDQPGMVGRFGMALAARDINIAGLHLGRHEPPGEALMLLQIDEPAPPDLVAELREAMAVATVQAVTLP